MSLPRSIEAPYYRCAFQRHDDAQVLLNDWSTEMRYLSGTIRFEEAEGFLSAAKEIIKWSDGRL
jgi:hypothetical protein